MRIATSILALVLVALFMSCSGRHANSKKSLEIVEKYITAIQTDDLATMEALLADDYKGYGPSINDSIDKKGAVESWKILSEDLYESISYEEGHSAPFHVPEGRIRGDWVANWGRLKVKYKNGLGPVELYINVVYKVEDGKIVRSRTFYNEADVIEQLGM